MSRVNIGSSGVLILFVLLCAPVIAHAEGTVVIFFKGLCNSAAACQASEQAMANIGPKLGSGARLVTPDLVNGAFPSQGSLNSLLSSVGNDKIVIVAYSAGYNALYQMTNAMNTNQLKQIKGIASLEAAYGGFESAVQRVQSVNPNVQVARFSSNQFSTNHGSLPGAPGVGDAIGAMANAAQNGTTADLSNIPNYGPYQAQVAQSAYTYNTGGSNPSSQSYFPGLASNSGYTVPTYGSALSGNMPIYASSPVYSSVVPTLPPSPLPTSLIYPSALIVAPTSTVSLASQNSSSNSNTNTNTSGIVVTPPPSSVVVLAPKDVVSTFPVSLNTTDAPPSNPLSSGVSVQQQISAILSKISTILQNIIHML